MTKVHPAPAGLGRGWWFSLSSPWHFRFGAEPPHTLHLHRALLFHPPPRWYPYGWLRSAATSEGRVHKSALVFERRTWLGDNYATLPAAIAWPYRFGLGWMCVRVCPLTGRHASTRRTNQRHPPASSERSVDRKPGGERLIDIDGYRLRFKSFVRMLSRPIRLSKRAGSGAGTRRSTVKFIFVTSACK